MLKIFFIMLIGYSTLFSYTGLKKVKFYKNFKQNHYTDASGGTGAGLYASSYLKIDENGLRGGAYLKIKAKILGKRVNGDDGVALLRYEASIDPTSFVNTYSDLKFYILGDEVYIVGANMYDKTKKTVPTVTVKTSDINSSTQLKQKQRAAKIKEAKSIIDSSGDPIIGIKENSPINIKMPEFSRTLFIGPLPLYLHFKAGGTAGVDIKAGLTGLTTFTAGVIPYANIYVDGKVGLGAKFYKEFDCCYMHGTVDFGYVYGLGSSLTLLDEKFNCSLTAGLKFNANEDYITSIDAYLHENIFNDFTAAHGELYKFVEYYGPNIEDLDDLMDGHPNMGLFPWNWDEQYSQETLASFSSKRYKKTLLDKTQSLFTIPLYSENDDILLYKESSCKGDDIGVFDSAYTTDVSCKESLSCEDNQAKSLLIRKNVAVGTKIYLYDNPDKKTDKNNFAVIRVKEKLKNDVCINGFQHQTTKEEKANGVSLSYYKAKQICVSSGDYKYCYTPDIKSHLTGYVSHVKITH